MLGAFRVSYISAGFITVLVGYASAAAIVFQAAAVAGASASETSSWLWALGIGMGLSCIGLSLKYRMPILTAWSTPGAALLVTSLSGLSLSEAVGVFMFSSLLIMLCGLGGILDKIMRHVPSSLAAAMLAGVLLQFGINLFTASETSLLLVSAMLTTYLLCKPLLPRYVVILSLGSGLIVATLAGQISLQALSWELATPIWVTPQFNLSALLGIGIPLFIVTMTSQNLPGIAALRAHGYTPPPSPLIATTGVTGFLLAPFGGFAFNLAAITAAICMSEEVDPEPNKRYYAAIWAGIFYLLAGILGASIVGLFAALPNELIMAIAGIALLGTIGNSLSSALTDSREREAALLTFLITASGVSLFSVGSAFWGLLIGLIAYHMPKRAEQLRQTQQSTPLKDEV